MRRLLLLRAYSTTACAVAIDQRFLDKMKLRTKQTIERKYWTYSFSKLIRQQIQINLQMIALLKYQETTH